ncbi:Rqc2 family fibronectin-binding protein [Geoalkalibacter sp.]|uniref:Rqc2 family fibronectin-binding protein n=1 Tax=Geoalkalibacter sp. TaxID=3041440 RepID=UPI00272E951B|nr:NFACT family protein [Geoalkalibacter sp.]
MDIDLLRAVTAELQQCLTGARFDKIYQPEADLFIFRLWNGRDSLRLLVSPSPRFPRLYLTTQAFPNPGAPPRFAQLLRARLSRLVRIEQVPEERIVHFHCTGPQGEAYLLALELLGRRSNLLLVDEQGTIVDLWERDKCENTLRDLRPGQPYGLPAPRQVQGGQGRPMAETGNAGSPSTVAESYYRQLLVDADEVGEQKQLLRLVERRLTRVRGRLEKIRAEQQALAATDRWRELGELLLANLYRIKRGQAEIQLEDYYQEPPRPISIELDPRLTPAENAERYFRRYKKGRRGAEHIARRLAETAEETAWLETVQHALRQAQEPVDVVMIRGELEEAGLLPSQGNLAKRAPVDPRSRLRSTLSPGGYRIFWGRNNRTNDYVSRELAEAADWWFHAKDLPGCHLVLKVWRKDEDVPEEDLLYAAALAAGYSRGAEAGKVEVMVTRAAEVRKPKGAPSGLVQVRSYRSVRVEPKKLPEP